MERINTVLITTVLTVLLPLAAHADWSGADMHMHPMAPAAPHMARGPVPSFHHETRVNPTPARVGPRPPIKPIEIVRKPAVDQNRQIDRRRNNDRGRVPDYFRRDVNYYEQVPIVLPYADVDSGFAVPDGFETIAVDNQTCYYHDGAFYEIIDNQLTAIPAVLGAVVDSIPQDYQIVMADGVHFLVSGGVYYQRVDQGFQVVQPPTSDQE